MSTPVLSADQQRAFDALEPLFKTEKQGLFAVTGKAGSGKTLLLSQLVNSAKEAGVDIVQPEFEGKKPKGRSMAVLAPTNKAASVLRLRGVPATTIHRILYRPIYDPDFEAIAEWLTGQGTRPTSEKVTSEALDRAHAFYEIHASIPGALAAAGARGSDFIQGWKRREEALDIGLIDESSMLDDQQVADLQEIFPTLVLFGDPAQLAPVGNAGSLAFDRVEKKRHFNLQRIHRQADDNPILDLAHMLGDPELEFRDFEDAIRTAAAKDDRIVVSHRADTKLMSRSPLLVWRNATRKRLIAGFRAAYTIPEDGLISGEPLICDGIELPAKHRKKRIDLEARGLIKGAQVVYLGPGKKQGFARLYVMGAPDPYVSVASIISIENPQDDGEPRIITAARMGAAFIHGAASTIHKAQGSQWPEIQIFGPDIRAAAFSNRTEAGVKLWKRLAYVALTRAETRVHWITDYRMSKPDEKLDTYDLRALHDDKPVLELTREADGDNEQA